jgi:hypothetical protein
MVTSGPIKVRKSFVNPQSEKNETFSVMIEFLLLNMGVGGGGRVVRDKITCLASCYTAPAQVLET